MTKEEMLKEYAAKNYEDVQRHIKEAVMNGQNHEYFGQEAYSGSYKPDWICLNETIDRLKKDGFAVREYGFDGVIVEW